MEHELIPYKTMPTWTAETLPEPFRKMHNTKVGTWAHLTILEGSLTFYELDEEGNVLAQHLFTKDSEIPFVEPQAWHRVSPASDDLKCYLTFYCTPEDYFAKKYDLTRTHSEGRFYEKNSQTYISWFTSDLEQSKRKTPHPRNFCWF